MKNIYKFSGSACEWNAIANEKLTKAVLGGKGFGLVKMAQAGFNVPPGFTITTEVCNEYLNADDAGRQQLMTNLMEDVVDCMIWLRGQIGFMPLVSVRSGAPISMPGMMDTILNVGLTTKKLPDWVKRIGERAAIDSQRRLIQMLGSTGFGVNMLHFDKNLATVKSEVGVSGDTDLTALHLAQVVIRNMQTFKEITKIDFPNNLGDQLRSAIEAVFKSWANPRAIEYRKLNGISPAMGTACTVQAMVFGNMGDDSGTGVLFTRNPNTGTSEMFGEFLPNAQGEDVVAGIRTPLNVSAMSDLGPGWHSTWKELVSTCEKLEVMYQDMVDLEFTVQQGKLFILQSRTGKRSARAAFKIAADMVDEDVIDVATALSRLSREQYKTIQRPAVDPTFKGAVDVTGLAACPGVAVGVPVFSAAEAVASKEPCILVTHETTPDDIAGMAAAVGILTQTGGSTSHAAVVARAMDKTCVVGATLLNLSGLKTMVKNIPGLKITLCGLTGRVWFHGEVPVVSTANSPEVVKVKGWCVAANNGVLASALPGTGTETQVVRAQDWWGNPVVATAVLTAISNDDPKRFILDIRDPAGFLNAAERELMMSFGKVSDDGFGKVLSTMVNSFGTKLDGMKFVTTANASDFLHAAPIEYHVMSRLG